MTTLSQLKQNTLANFDKQFHRVQCVTPGMEFVTDRLVEAEGEKIKAFIAAALDTAVKTAFRENEVEKLFEAPHGTTGQGIPVFKKGYNSALAEKTKLEEEFINS